MERRRCAGKEPAVRGFDGQRLGQMQKDFAFRNCSVVFPFICGKYCPIIN